MPYDIIIGRDDSDKKKFGKRGLVKIGRGYVKMGQYTSLSNPIYLDVSRSHVILVAGKRGSGKSYTLGAIAEEISMLPEEVSKNISPIIFDTMGIFWTMKYENEKEKRLLEEWGLKPQKVPIKVFAPFGFFEDYVERGIAVDEPFAIKVSELTAEDWIMIFDLKITEPIAVLLEKTISNINEKEENFDINDIIQSISTDKTSTQEDKNALISLFESVKTWGIFADKNQKETKIQDLLNPGVSTIIDLSTYNSIGAFNIRALIIGLVCKKIFNERTIARKKEEIDSLRHGVDYLSFDHSREVPLVWIFIDEAHEFLPKQGQTLATDSLIQILREGRQPGISLVLATQQPGQIHKDVMTQSDIVISHRLTSLPDITALNEIMQTYLFGSIKQYIDDLPHLKGSAIILDDNSERIYPIRVRPRFTWHGGETPTSIKIDKSELI